MDFRFGPDIKAWLEKEGLLGDVDIASMAGAVKNLVDPAQPTDVEFAMRQIDLSKRLHEIKKVVLMNHTDCGGYGGRKAFASMDEETARHAGDLEKAAAMVTAKYPDLEVVRAIAHIDDAGAIRIETL